MAEGGICVIILDPGNEPLHNKWALAPPDYYTPWLGWAYFSIKVRVPWHQGVYFDLPMIFNAYSTQNSQGIVKSPRAVLVTYARAKLATYKKRFFDPPVGLW